MTDTPPLAPLAQVVGQNAKRLRDGAGATLDEVAKAARAYGLGNWGTGRVSDLEHGKVSPTLSTLIALSLALGDVHGQPIRLAELVEHDGMVALTGELVVTSEALSRFVAGDEVQLLVDDVPPEAVPDVDWEHALVDEPRRRREILKLLPELGKVEMPVMLQVERQSGEAELKMARALGVDRWLVDLASAARWGRTLAAERDDRAGTDANAQKRGRITRELKAELEATLRAVLDGDHK